MSDTPKLLSAPRIQVETFPWLRSSAQLGDLDGLPAGELLEIVARRWPPNVRAVREPSGVMLVADDYAEPYNRQSAEERLRRWWHAAEASESFAPPNDDLVEILLFEFGVNITRREAMWIVPSNPACGAEVEICRIAGGLLVQATLVDLADAPTASREAVGEFLCRAQETLRFVRAEMDGQSARVVSQSNSDRWDTDLGHALDSVSTAVGLLLREAQALLQPDLARRYLEMLSPAKHSASSE